MEVLVVEMGLMIWTLKAMTLGALGVVGRLEMAVRYRMRF